MRARRGWLLPLALVVMSTTACGQAAETSVTAGDGRSDGAVASSSEGSGHSEHPSNAGTPLDLKPSRDESTRVDIRKFSFGDAVWDSLWSQRQTVQLKGGTASVNGMSARLKGAPQYVDIDGDGVEDALATLVTEEGNGYGEFTYAWVVRGTEVRQVLPAVGMTEGCGDKTDAITAGGDGTLKATVRRKDPHSSCAESGSQAPEKITIMVKDGYAWQSAPSVSALRCVAEPGRGMAMRGAHLMGKGLRAFPAPDAPVIATAAQLKYYDLADTQSDMPTGWTRLLMIRADSDKRGRTPCAFGSAG